MDEKIMQLIAEYCSGEISSEGMEQLSCWTKLDLRNMQWFEECLKAHRAGLEMTLTDRLDERKAWKQFLLRVPPRQKHMIRYMRVAGVAAVLIFFSVLVGRKFFFYESECALVDAMPGGIKATLVLNDGQQIALDEFTQLDISEEKGLFLQRDSGRSSLLTEKIVGEVGFHTIQVPRGGEFYLMLADSTQVWLNSETELHFPSTFAGGKREVFLSGEACLEVKKNTDAPFIVKTPHGMVTVTGTVFNVSDYPDDRRMITSLLSGRVEVSVEGLQVTLDPMQVALWKAGEIAIEVKQTDVSSAFSWIKGVFDFEDLALNEILMYLSRWYDVTFEFAESDIEEIHFTGGARKYVPLSDFLKAIERACSIRFIQEESKVWVERRQDEK